MITLTSASSPTPISGRYQVTLYGGTPTVQIAAIPVDPNAALTWIGATSVTAAAITGSSVTFTAEFGQGHLVRVTGTGSVLFGRIPGPITNAA